MLHLHHWTISVFLILGFILSFFSCLSHGELNPFTSASASSSTTAFNAPLRREKDDRIRVLLLDIDGTLYDKETEIEQQIRDFTYSYVGKYRSLAQSANNCDFKETIEYCDQLYRKYGSTIAGYCKEQCNYTIMDTYFKEIFPHINVLGLHRYSGGLSHRKDSDQSKTGYDHFQMISSLRALPNLSRHLPIAIATNSPFAHVRRVLRRLGLADLKVFPTLLLKLRAHICHMYIYLYICILYICSY
jgi:beta-phosphoglucomutase-like phosphatase (HAD superfamily)